MRLDKKIAVLLACHNRKDKTVRSLGNLFEVELTDGVSIDVFLVDDGSTDGTADEIGQKYPQVHIITGNGSLFWAGGMRLAWESAMAHGSYDYYWLLNDDTFLYPTALKQLLSADEYSMETYGKQGIYTGSTKDPDSKAHSYGGQRLVKQTNYASLPVLPDGTYQKCDFCNANILLVPAFVVNQLGILSKSYTHSIADYDYSMRAVRSGIPALVLPDYAGECVENLGVQKLESLSLIRRVQHLLSPKGYSYAEFLHFIRTFFPKTYLKTVLTLWIRTLFPSQWKRFKGIEKQGC